MIRGINKIQLRGRRRGPTLQYLKIYLGRLHIQGDIDPYGTRSTASGLEDRPIQMISNARRFFHGHDVLRDGADHSHNVKFLKTHLADARIPLKIRTLHLA
jgi:hypothetical protein